MKMRTQNNGIRNEQGFTIVEVLVALIIFSIAVAGVITVAAQGGLSVNAAKDKLTATYLADEGIELMRGLRDTDVVSQPVGSESVGWNNFLSQTITAGVCASTGSITAPCDIDSSDVAGSSITPMPPFPSSINLIPCPAAGCPLYYNADTGFYGDIWTGTTAAPVPHFFRKITVSQGPSPDEATITSTVTWKEGSTPQSITQTEEIFNWYGVSGT